MYICELGGFLVNGNETPSLKIPSTMDVEIVFFFFFLRSTNYDVVPLPFHITLFSLLLCSSLKWLLLFHCLFVLVFCVCVIVFAVLVEDHSE